MSTSTPSAATALDRLPSDVRVPEPREPSAAQLFLMEGARKEHREREGANRRGTAGKPKRRAVLTIVHNESVFLPIWLRYYSRFFAPEDIYVLDHETSDGSTDRGGFVRIPVSHESVDHTWMVSTIERQQSELFESYDVVLVTDVDEIVAPRPECGTLGEYIDRVNEEEFLTCYGYELIHLIDRECPFDPSRKVLDQRGYWFHNGAYSKPALTMKPSHWEAGFHAREDGRVQLDPDLCLIHLHRMDYDICLARHRYRRGRRWNERDISLNWARHNLIVDDDDFARWFYGDNSVDDLELQVQSIPASWRGVF
jgi:Glycosyl transferase family 2